MNIVESDIFAYLIEKLDLYAEDEVLILKTFGITSSDMNRIYDTLHKRGLLDASQESRYVN